MVWDYMSDTTWKICQDEIPALTLALKPLELSLERSVVLELFFGPAAKERFLEHLAGRNGKALSRIDTFATATVEVYLIEHARILEYDEVAHDLVDDLAMMGDIPITH